MNESNPHKVWKVQADDATEATCTFDARLLFHDRIDRSVDQLMPDSAPSPKGDYFNHPVPFEQALPNRPFTLVVRARGAASMVVSVEDVDGNGLTGGGHWCRGSSAIIVYNGSGSVSTTLPDEDIDQVPMEASPGQ